MNPQQWVLITGASSGIGHDAARELLAHGYGVLGSVRTAADAAPVEQELGAGFKALLFDVTDAGAIAAAVAQVERIVGAGGLAALVNNAGIAPTGPLMHMPLAEFQRAFDINVYGVLRVTQAFLPLLGARRDCPHAPGRIVNLSSISGGITIPMIGAYAATKFALEALGDGLRRELSIYGIEVVAIEPGSIRTPIWDKVAADTRYGATDYAEAMAKMPEVAAQQARQGKPVEIVSRAIRHAIMAPRPRTRYPLTALWYLRHLLPARLLDRALCAQAGLKSRLKLRLKSRQ